MNECKKEVDESLKGQSDQHGDKTNRNGEAEGTERSEKLD